MFPHIRYFAYYIARGVLARDNTSNIAAPDIAILAAALKGDYTYNIGALIARRLVTNGEKGPHYGGIYATLIAEHRHRAIRADDFPLPFLRFDLNAMKRHEFVTRTSEFGNLVYMMKFGEVTTREIRIPAPLLFDFSSRNGWSFTATELDEFVAQQQFYAPMKGDAPEEEEPEEILPPQEESVARWGEGSSSWGGESSSWEDSRTSVYAPEAPHDPWTYQYYPGAGGSSLGPQ